MCCRWKRWRRTLVTAVELASNDHPRLLNGLRSKWFLSSNYFWVQTRNLTQLREEKKVGDKDRGLCLDYCSIELSLVFQIGTLYCFTLTGGWVGNMTPQPCIAVDKGTAMRAWLALKGHWKKQLFNRFSLLMSGWHSQCCNTQKSYNYSMWSVLGPVLPRLMSFPKVWMLHVSLILSLFVPRSVLLTLLMTSKAQQNQISIGMNCSCWFLIIVSVHRWVEACINCLCSTHILVCVYALLLEIRVFTPGTLWLCSGLTLTMLLEIHSQRL